MSSIDERVKKIVAEQLGVKEEDVKNEASFVEDLGADSLDTVELVMALEEEFETEIPDEEAEKILYDNESRSAIKNEVLRKFNHFLVGNKLLQRFIIKAVDHLLQNGIVKYFLNFIAQGAYFLFFKQSVNLIA